jgi:putative IMPACT (imprinted ancient) family translation regulator
MSSFQELIEIVNEEFQKGFEYQHHSWYNSVTSQNDYFTEDNTYLKCIGLVCGLNLSEFVCFSGSMSKAYIF